MGNESKIRKDQIVDIIKSWRVILLAIAILFSIIAINPHPFAKGVFITSIGTNSSAEINGVQTGDLLFGINEDKIETTEDFTKILASKSIGDLINLQTESGEYSVIVGDLNGENSVGVVVDQIPTSHINKGLDLVGGTRVILKPAEEVSDQQLEDIVDIIKERLNVYGVSDIVARPTKDLQRNNYIIVELAGTSQEETSKLLSQQGKFEAKIGNKSVFSGGKDITYVCRSADCSGINYQEGCSESGSGWACTFQFLINLDPAAAKRHAEITNSVPVITVGNKRYLKDKLDLYLDNVLVDSLYISEGLKGSDTTSITIQGPGYGATRELAVDSALENMKGFQTVLISGSLPIKLNVVKMDIVSPTLGEKFLSSALVALFAALLAVGGVIFIRYRKLKLAVPILITGLSEVLIILGFAALINWNLDLAAIAGILAAVGTGVDDQVVITDEALRGERVAKNWKSRMKNAFFIIFAAYFTTVVAMLPLWWMGAGLIRGFALTTIAGVTIGVLITRPAYAKIIEILMRKE